MKIKKEDIFKFAKIFKDIPYKPANEKNDLIVFPIDNTKVVEDSGFELNIQPTTSGVAKDPEPVLIVTLKNDGKYDYTGASLGYADLTYARKFSIKDYTALLDYKVTKGIKELDGYECFLLKQDYLLAEFDF